MRSLPDPYSCRSKGVFDRDRMTTMTCKTLDAAHSA